MSVNRVWISFYKDAFTCGEPIQGSVNVSIKQAVPNLSLKLKLKAYEEAKWIGLQPLTIPEYQIVKQNNVVVTDDSSDSEDEKVYEKKRFEYIRNDSGSIFKVSRGEGKRRMMGQTQDLGPLGVGHYQFPFQFNSLREWPGSFLQEDGRMKGKVKYNVIGWYGPARGNAEFFLQEFKQSELDKHESVTSITSCCCCPKGDVKLEALFLKDALYIGEEQTVQIKLDCSKLSCNVGNVNGSLVNQVIYYLDQVGQIQSSTTIFNKTWEGCQAGQVKSQEQRFTVNFPDLKQQSRPTCNGQKIKSRYYLVLSTNNDASCTCCSTDPVVSNDTFIYCRPYNVQPVYNEPGWNPTVSPVINIALQTPIHKQRKINYIYPQAPPGYVNPFGQGQQPGQPGQQVNNPFLNQQPQQQQQQQGGIQSNSISIGNQVNNNNNINNNNYNNNQGQVNNNNFQGNNGQITNNQNNNQGGMNPPNMSQQGQIMNNNQPGQFNNNNNNQPGQFNNTNNNQNNNSQQNQFNNNNQQGQFNNNNNNQQGQFNNQQGQFNNNNNNNQQGQFNNNNNNNNQNFQGQFNNNNNQPQNGQSQQQGQFSSNNNVQFNNNSNNNNQQAQFNNNNNMPLPGQFQQQSQFINQQPQFNNNQQGGQNNMNQPPGQNQPLIQGNFNIGIR